MGWDGLMGVSSSPGMGILTCVVLLEALTKACGFQVQRSQQNLLSIAVDYLPYFADVPTMLSIALDYLPYSADVLTMLWTALDSMHALRSVKVEENCTPYFEVVAGDQDFRRVRGLPDMMLECLFHHHHQVGVKSDVGTDCGLWRALNLMDLRSVEQWGDGDIVHVLQLLELFWIDKFESTSI